MTIRKAEVLEAESIVSLINAAFLIEKFFVESDRIDLKEVMSYFAKGEFLVLTDDAGTSAGCVFVEQRGERAYFGLLSIDPARQRMGLGRRLVDASEDWARTRGCRHMDIRIVNLRQELPGFYNRLGYVETGTEPFTPQVPTLLPCHFVNMTKPL